jgi:hypothetical protein
MKQAAVLYICFRFKSRKHGIMKDGKVADTGT